MKLFSKSGPAKPGSRTQDTPVRQNRDNRTVFILVAFCLVCGVLVILLGGLAVRITAYAAAAALLFAGGQSVYCYLQSEPLVRIREARLAVGFILLLTGILLAFNTDLVNGLLPFIWGLVLLFGGFLKIQYAFDEKTVGVEKWWIMLILASVSIIIGVVSLLNPGNSTLQVEYNNYLLIGIMLVAEAALDTTVYFLLRQTMSKKENHATVTIPSGRPEESAVQELPAQAEPVQETPSQEE
jgi:uncharacterized membrane protein HdeD (DUF308 family)